VHRKKQQWARHCLQASSRQAVQESATAMARPLNLSTMAATSTVPQDISDATVHQSIVEGRIVCDLKVAEWMGTMSTASGS